MKHAQFVYHLNTFHLLKTKVVKKQLIKCYKAENFSPVFDNMFTANILEMREKRGSFILYGDSY